MTQKVTTLVVTRINSRMTMMTIYLSRRNVQELLQISQQAVAKACKKGRFNTVLTNGNGGAQYRIALTSLPSPAQVRWIQANPEQAKSLPIALISGLSCDAKEAIAGLSAKAQAAPEIKPEEGDIYMIDNEDTGKVSYAIKQYLLNPCYKTVERTASELDIHPATIYRWINRAKEQKNKTYIEVQDQRVPIRLPRTSIPYDAVLQSLSVILSHQKARIKQGHEYLTSQGCELSYAQYTRILSSMEPSFGKLLRYHRSGRVASLLTDTPKIIRAWTKLPVMHTLVGDQHYMDYYFWSEELQDTVKFTLYIWMDCTSRYFCSCVPASGNYTQWHVQASLIEAFRIHTPDEIYTDWGKQETSKATEALIKRLGTGRITTADYDGFIDRYPDSKLKRKHSAPGVPPVKPIEAGIRRLTEFLNQRGIAGYMRRELQDPFRSKQIQDELKRARKKEALLSVEEGMQALVDAIAACNNTGIKTEEGEMFVPADFLWHGIAGRRVVWSEEDLAMMFYPQKKRKVRNASVQITISGKRVIFTARELAYMGGKEEVVVFVNPFPPHDGSMIFRTRKGDNTLDYLCPATVWQGYKIHPQEQEALKRAMEVKYAYLKQFTLALREIHKHKTGGPAVTKIGEVSRLAKEVRKKAEVVMLPQVKKEDLRKKNWHALGKLADIMGY